MLILSFRCFFGFFKELGGSLRECLSKTAIAVLGLDEVDIACGRFLGIYGKRILSFCLKRRIVTEHLPISGVNRLLHFTLAVGHTALKPMHFAGSVTDNNGRTVISLSFCKRLERLIHIGTHSDLCYIHISIGHSDLCKILLADCLTGSRELSYLTNIGGLGSLSAGVGVNLGIKYHYIDIFAGSDNMIKSAEANVISPAVSAEYPYGLLGEVILIGQNFLGGFVTVSSPALKKLDKLFGCLLICLAVVNGIQIIVYDRFALLAGSFKSFYLFDQTITDRLLTEIDSETVFCIIFKQGVAPSGTD